MHDQVFPTLRKLVNIFVWLMLSNKILTWDDGVKWNWHGSKQFMPRQLRDTYKPSRRLSDSYAHHFKKKIIFLIFGTVKTKNPRVVEKNRRILDQNWVKNETSQNSIFPSSIDAPSLGRGFQLIFSPKLLGGASECQALAFNNGF